MRRAAGAACITMQKAYARLRHSYRSDRATLSKPKSLKALALLSVTTLIGVKADDSQDFMTKLMASVQSDSTVDATF